MDFPRPSRDWTAQQRRGVARLLARLLGRGSGREVACTSGEREQRPPFLQWDRERLCAWFDSLGLHSYTVPLARACKVEKTVLHLADIIIVASKRHEIKIAIQIFGSKLDGKDRCQ